MGALLLILGTYPISGQTGSKGMPQGIAESRDRGAPARGAREEVSVTPESRLSEEEGRYLVSEARRTIEGSLFGNKGEAPSMGVLSPKFHERHGTFVTLTKGGQLRGCIGHILPSESVIEGVRTNAINAAFHDPRFPPVSGEEWRKIKIEVSVLTSPRPLAYASAQELLERLRPNVDGVILKKGSRQATFLPQVWEQLPRAEEFLTHLCLKAGLDGAAWKRGDLEISTYQVQAFEE
jgi:AmmeMemoRadiSam system protein A